jgi:exodeoxyribonuclease V gamma subunit
MSGLNIYSSNRMEALFDMLAQALVTPLPTVFESEIIVVQNKGIERWVSMELAQRFGICANYLFPFPNRIVFNIFKMLIPAIDEENFITKDYMTWRLMDILPHMSESSEFASIRNYLKDGRMIKRYQLSCRLAEVFDMYTLYRPQMIMNWQEGEDDHWQAQLWREVVQGREEAHFAALRKLFFEKMNTINNKEDLPDKPARLSVFGISALPDYHLEILSAASQIMDIHIFFLNPCKHYWADIMPFRVIEKKTRKKDKRKLTARDLYLEEGNSLLASMGVMGRDFFRAIQNLTFQDFQNFVDPGSETLLSLVQSDIFELTNRDLSHKTVIDDHDESMGIYSCHSPMREMEVLYDNLLHLFAHDSSLEPRDVVVMTPDIELYTPFIEAVFGTFEDESRMIPFSIADQGARRISPIIETFLMLLSLPAGRFGASSVLTLLESEPLLRAFALHPAHQELIKRWIHDTEIRWGIDENNRAQYGVPPLKENTWKAGLERLMLGYAMSSGSERLFNDILPCEGPEGEEAQVLGKLMEFMDKLFKYSRRLEHDMIISQWSEVLLEILTTFFHPDEDSERDIQIIRQVIDDLIEISKDSQFEEKIDLHVILSYLNTHLSEDRFGRGFIVGKVTFCTLIPMRSIPFKVVCLVGMNDGAFPRISRNHSFDLMAERPHSGDPSREKEDRYLFLEALISARRNLLISYIGQNVTDNTQFPPSVVVSELIDYLDEGFVLASGASVKDRIVKKHRLQAFSPEYFKPGNTLFSYSQENYTASHSLVNPSFTKPEFFINHGLSEPEEDYYTLDIEQLYSFFSNPPKYLLTRRPGLYLKDMSLPVSEREPFYLDPLDNYLLSQYLVEKRLKGSRSEHFYKIIKAQGKLPHANVGTNVYERMSGEVEFFINKIKKFNVAQAEKPLSLYIDIERAGFRIVGHIDHLYSGRLIHFRCATVKPKDRLRLWIYHLIMMSAGYEDSLEKSIVIGTEDTVWEFLPLKEADSILENLLYKYWKGLNMPLHFFPDSSWAYAKALLLNNKNKDEALKEAEKRWLGNDYSCGEGKDLYYQQCFGAISPLDNEFMSSSVEIFEPLIMHQREVSL